MSFPTDQSKKGAPREFWLIQNPVMKRNWIVNYDSYDRMPMPKYWNQHVHVIEYSAYSLLLKQNQILREVLKSTLPLLKTYTEGEWAKIVKQVEEVLK